jgi:hypothetical protein
MLDLQQHVARIIREGHLMLTLEGLASGVGLVIACPIA